MNRGSALTGVEPVFALCCSRESTLPDTDHNNRWYRASLSHRTRSTPGYPTVASALRHSITDERRRLCKIGLDNFFASYRETSNNRIFFVMAYSK